jgi:hypothetical protein
MACSGLSLLATTSLLCVLGFTALRRYIQQKTPGRRTSVQRSVQYPQGFFWLVNLFVAGSTI